MTEGIPSGDPSFLYGYDSLFLLYFLPILTLKLGCNNIEDSRNERAALRRKDQDLEEKRCEKDNEKPKGEKLMPSIAGFARHLRTA
jgi:hypothetical protein